MQKNLEDADSYSNLSDEPSIVLSSGEIVSEREWKRRFDDEWYNSNRNGEYEVISSKSGQKEAKRNMNSGNRDLLSVAEKTGSLVELSENESEFMEDASDDWSWRNAFKVLGPEAASELIFSQAKRDLKDGNVDKALAKFYIKMSDLKSLLRKETRKDK